MRTRKEDDDTKTTTHRFRCVLAGLLTFVALAGDGNAQTVIDFDDRPGMPSQSDIGDPIDPKFMVNDEYVNLGVIFDSGGGGISIGAPSNPVSPPNTASATGPGPVTGVGMYPVFAYFFVDGTPATTDWVSLDLSNTSHASVLTAYDSAGVLLDDDTGGASARLMVTAPGQIHEVRIEGVMAFDNFTFEGLRPIPEPATLSLLALGGLAMLRRRRALR